MLLSSHKESLLHWDDLVKLLSYDSEEGNFYWLVQRRGKGKKGEIAGSLKKPSGKIAIRINGYYYYACRLAYFYMTKTWPDTIDHINRNPSDNRWANLRNCTMGQNSYNRRFRKGSSNLEGVSLVERGTYKKWHSKIGVNNNVVSLGYFKSPEEAHDAYKKAVKIYHGDFARPISGEE